MIRWQWAIVALLVIAVTTIVTTQQSPSIGTITLANRYHNHISVNVEYRAVGDWRGRLDLYEPGDAKKPVPVILFFHGGGLRGPQPKESRVPFLLPWLEMGYAVVNVDYRDGVFAKAPAMVEDARCALRWVVEHADEHNIDVHRIITAGESMGAWLALLTGTMPSSAGLDGCSGAPLPLAAAVIDRAGNSDVIGALDGSSVRKVQAFVDWLDVPHRDQVAKAVSPLTYVRAGAPPVFIVHGDADPSSDYRHALILDRALKAADVDHELVTVPGGGHVLFADAQEARVWTALHAFLGRHHLLP